MRIVVKFPSKAYDELLADLEQIPPRTRAERMRLLASIGVVVLRSGKGLMLVSSFANGSATEAPRTVAEQDTAPTGFNRVRDKLKAGMAG